MTSWNIALRRRVNRGRSVVALLAALAIVVPATVVAAPPFERTTIQVLDISDWHAQLDPNSGIGGAAALSTYFDQHRAANPNTLTITAGDDFGASPPISSFFDEVPAILGERLMGIDIGTFGNHNFDRGIAHLQQMIDLAGSTDPSVVGDPFSYVSANLQNREAPGGLTGVEDYKIFAFDGVKVAVIGVTNPEAPTLVFPGNFGPIVPTDPAVAAMAARDAAEAAGADVFIAIGHLGITNTAAGTGPLTDFASNVRGFDLIIGDHTDVQFQKVIKGALVIENRSKSLTYSVTQLVVEKRPTKQKVISVANEFRVPTASAVAPDPAVVEMLAPFRAALQPILSVVLGTADKVIPRADSCGQSAGRLCESLIGDLVTDAMLAHFPDADFAITNSGGLRANLTCPLVDSATDFCPPQADPTNIQITRGQTVEVLPFGNFAVTVDMTGAEFKTVLEHSVSAIPAAAGLFGQVGGVCFTYNSSAAAGSRVTGAVTNVDGVCTTDPVDLTAGTTYTVAMNDFMAFGGDGYPSFALRQVSDGTTLLAVLEEFIVANTPISPDLEGRITCTGGSCPAAP